MEAEIVYQDSADVFMQLGILPRQGSAQERALRALHSPANALAVGCVERAGRGGRAV